MHAVAPEHTWSQVCASPDASALDLLHAATLIVVTRVSGKGKGRCVRSRVEKFWKRRVPVQPRLPRQGEETGSGAGDTADSDRYYGC